MAKHGKKYRAALAKVNIDEQYLPQDALKLVNPFRLEQDIFNSHFFTGHTFMQPGVIFNMLWHFGRFRSGFVAGRDDIIPGKFA